MICLGFCPSDKPKIIDDYARDNNLAKVVILSPEKFQNQLRPHLPADFPPHEFVDYPEIIMYRTFYRLLQEIDNSTLLVINECLRTQNRNDLTYNCVRHYLNQTRHQIVFQYLPQIDEFADFMTLADWDTRTKWKGQRFAPAMLDNLDVRVAQPPLAITERRIPINGNVHGAYRKKREQLFASIGSKDPHTIPRNLYQVTGKAKYEACDPSANYVGRNNRFGLPHLSTYRDVEFPSDNIVFELPHNFIDFADFLCLSLQTTIPILTTETKCDQWYFARYRGWLNRINDAYAEISRHQRS